jgi:Domain of unknown function (DUF397)
MPLDGLSYVRWFKSSYSADKGNCVEVAHVADGVAVRDTKHGDGSPVLVFTPAEWAAFIDGAKDGEFDRR